MCVGSVSVCVGSVCVCGLCVFFISLLLSRLQLPVFPKTSLFSAVIGDAFALAVVGYGIAISLGRTFALKYGYKVDSNQVRQ